MRKKSKNINKGLIGGSDMSTSAIVMMILGCGIVWGGTFVSIFVALAVEKKNNLKEV